MTRTVNRRVLLGAVAALLAGCAAQGGAASSAAHPASPSASQSAATPQQDARADVSARLRGFVAPPGALQLTAAPAGSAAVFYALPTGANTVVATAYWTYPGTPQQAVGWFTAHPPKGNWGIGRGSTNGVPDELTFGWPGSALLQSRATDVSFAAYRGATLMRVEAEDTWRPAHPAAATVPTGVTRLVVTASRRSSPAPLPSWSPVTVTDPGLVARTVPLVDALPTAPVGVFSCPADFGAEITVDFYRGSGADAASPVAVAVDTLTGCQRSTLSVRGGSQQVALEGAGPQTLALLKLSFPPLSG